MGAALFVSSIGGVGYDALLAQGKFQFASMAFALTSLLQVILLVLFLNRGLWFAPTATLLTASVWACCFGEVSVASA
jgi:hypothetical protein